MDVNQSSALSEMELLGGLGGYIFDMDRYSEFGEFETIWQIWKALHWKRVFL